MSDKRVAAVLASIGANVRRCRLRKGLTQEGLAERCSVEPRTIQSIERGKTNLSIAVLVSVADGLGVDARSLMRAGELGPARPGRPPKKKKKQKKTGAQRKPTQTVERKRKPAAGAIERKRR
ncbi:MAG TPA: helix-turn-helix transcriptional regulator [Polyangiaceae bacterium]|nr:helix-turn-helix transcriptional regulator [Polyangiaceae bacterium]